MDVDIRRTYKFRQFRSFACIGMDAMKRLWGRKVLDLGFAQFVAIVEWGVFKRGKQVIFLDR